MNTSAYGGDINTSDIILDPPPELQGSINVVPEMIDIITLAIMNVGGEPCTEDLEILRAARDKLMAAQEERMKQVQLQRATHAKQKKKR